jgi:subtilisin family serine protease
MPAAADEVDNRSKLGFSKAELQRLAEARLQGETEITVLIAAKQGQIGSVANSIANLGGTVERQESAINYIRASVPIDQAEKASFLNGIRGIDIDQVIALDDPKPEGSTAPTPQTPPGASTPRNNPYMPIVDTGAVQFTAAHPTWDGRNIVVGVVDSGIDLDHPALQTTTTGQPKIVGWVTGTDGGFTAGGVNKDNDPTWLLPTSTLPGDYTYPVGPNPADLRFAVFNERDSRLGGEVGNDVNRDGNPPGSIGTFGVLWDTSTDEVRVDVNQDKSFADELVMVNQGSNFTINHFGTDNPATPVAERMPFVIQVDTDNDTVNIGIVSAQHGTHVAGIIAANGMFGGQMSGAAPGAQLVSSRACLFVTGCTSHGIVEAMYYLADEMDVDVINMSIGGLPALNDGAEATTITYNTLIDTYDIQLFFSAGNSGAGLNTIGDPSVATKVVSVGSYISKATWQKNYGSDSAYVDNLHNFSSRGPREDGGFKPNIVAPGSAISTTPLWQPGGPVGGTYALPPGYSMLNGTSMASPQATGAAALLLSGKPNTSPEVLRQVIYSSARLLDTSRIQVYEQGNGLLNIGAAWTMLAKSGVVTTLFSSSVAVNTPLGDFLTTPDVGVGIYDRPVPNSGSYVRQYTFTRTSGVGAKKVYQVKWIGNDGTFSSASSIDLPLNTPVTFNVTVNPTSGGVHSAILNLDDASTHGVDYQTMNVVIVPEQQFAAGNNYSVTKSGTVGRNQYQRFFFNVPNGAPAFKVDLTGGGSTPGTGQIRFLRFTPWGVNFESTATTNCYTPSAGSCGLGTPNSRTVVDPLPGVWEVIVEARRTSDVASAPFTLTASILGATVSPNPDVIASATIGEPIEHEYTITNLYGPFTGRAVGTTLGSAYFDTPTIANGVQQIFTFTVTPGSTSVSAKIGGPSDAAADLDLALYYCPGAIPGSCQLADSDADGDSEESVSYPSPPSGTWLVLVDGFSVPAGTTTYNYVDVFVNTAFGSVVVTDANALRPAGSSWIVPGTVTANAAPAAGRVLLGNVEVRTDTNVLIGSGVVRIDSVIVP